MIKGHWFWIISFTAFIVPLLLLSNYIAATLAAMLAFSEWCAITGDKLIEKQREYIKDLEINNAAVEQAFSDWVMTEASDETE